MNRWTKMVMIFLSSLLLATTAWAEEAVETIIHEVKTKEVEALLSKALEQEGSGDTVEAELMGTFPEVYYESKQAFDLAVAEVDFDARAGRFTAHLVLHEGDEAQQMELKGRFTSLTQIPVFNKRLYAGDVISESDIEWLPIAERRIRKDVIFSPKDLIGKSPRRVISEHRAIRVHEIEEPVITAKGDLVQISYRTPHMEIRALGRAMEDGAMNQRINVKNSDSDIVVQAIVTGPGTAEVKELMQLTQN